MLEEELFKLEELESRFGTDDEYAREAVLTWNMKFNTNITYTFVAIKVARDMWYTTSKYDKVMTFDALVEKYLSKALDGKVWSVAKWQEL